MNKTLLSVLLIAVCMCAYVNGHAKLVAPPAWNPDPSTAAPCGNGSPATAAGAKWIAGQPTTIQWTVVAGDGAGTFTVLLDTNGGSFTGADTDYIILAKDQSAPSVGDFYWTVTPPYTANCTGPNQLCSVRVHGQNGNGWTACATIAILPPCDGCPPPPPPPPKCSTATNLRFCTQYNNKVVILPDGVVAGAVDSQTQATFINYSNNTKVFSNGNSQACKAAYKPFICATNLPPCPGSDGVAVGQACRSQCRATMTTCGIQEAHAALYPCDQLPLCPGESAAASIAPVWAMMAVIAVFVALF